MSDMPKKRGRPLSSPDGFSYSEWYASNKENLAKRRKEKYDSDPEHRANIIARNKESRRKIRELGLGKKTERSYKRRPVEMSVEVDGVPTVREMYYIGTLAIELDVSVPTIRGWEIKGLLPKTPFISTIGSRVERLYTTEMITAVKDVFSSRGKRVSVADVDFSAEISSKWGQLGVI